LILRGKRIGMTLKESVELIDMYDPSQNNTQQLAALIDKIDSRRNTLLQQKYDIEEMLRGLDEVQQLCRETLGKKRKIAR
jgi:DNA-binding transcriptional MerR regulator